MCQLMPGEFLWQFFRVIRKDWQDVLTLLDWSLWRTPYHARASVLKMPPSWHWTCHSGCYWLHVELCTEIVQAKQWWWWWWWWWWWSWCGQLSTESIRDMASALLTL